MAENTPEKNKDYGLPKVDPQPIQRDPTVVEKKPIFSEPEKSRKDRKPIIILLSVLGLLVVCALIYLIFMTGDSGSGSGPVTVEDRVVMEPEDQQDNDEAGADSEPDTGTEVINTEEPGSIITISERTNRYYIFVGSYKFRAYAHRHAEKLAADGFAVKLITPDNWVGMRVAVGNYANVEEASNDAQQIRSKYGNEVVISKY